MPKRPCIVRTHRLKNIFEVANKFLSNVLWFLNAAYKSIVNRYYSVSAFMLKDNMMEERRYFYHP